jgi:hypothetical protein
MTCTLPSPIAQEKYADIAESENIDVADYLRKLWSNYSSKVMMFILHEINFFDQIHPNRSEEAPARQHASSFFEAVQRKKFCNLDTDKLIKDHTVQEFFTAYMPQLLGQKRL